MLQTDPASDTAPARAMPADDAADVGGGAAAGATSADNSISLPSGSVIRNP